MGKLFIRNQSKTGIEEVYSVRVFDKYEGNPNNLNGYEDKKYVGTYIEVNGNYFGLYKTRERAMEILDEVCNFLNGIIIAQPKQTLKAKEKVGVVDDNKGVELKQVNTVFVYQMPNE